LAANAFIVPDLDGGNRDIVFLLRDDLDTVNRTKRDTDLAARAIGLINHGHEFGPFFFAADFIREIGNCFIEIGSRSHQTISSYLKEWKEV